MSDNNGRPQNGGTPQEAAHTVRMRRADKNGDTIIKDANASGASAPVDANADAERADETEDGEYRDPTNTVTGAVVGAVKGIIYLTAVIVIGIALAFFFVIPVANDVFAFVKEEAVIDVTVPENATLNDITEILYDNGLISYPRIFKLYAEFTENENDPDAGVYIAGDYALSTTLNYGQLIDSFKPSHETGQISLTIREGMTTDEIIDLFVENGIGTKAGFIDAINKYDWSEDFNYWFLDELEENGWSEDRFYRLDGYLFPDTYYFYTDSSEVVAISKLLDNFEAKFPDTYRIFLESKNMTVDEAVTIASMVQSEAGGLAEYALVSSVFNNRLANSASYPYLESDATILYAMFHNDHSRPDKLSGTEYDSPYNTYKYRGLPPGPICNPGFEALTYAIYPRTTDYFYFVANNDGFSVFSETLAEHNRAIEDVKNGTAISTVRQGGGSGEYVEDDEDEE